MRLLTRSLATLFAIAVLATGAVADTAFTESAERIYLRGTGCGATEDLFLSDRAGVDEYDGCGAVGGLPVNEVTAAEDTLSTRDVDPVIVDATRDLEVVIRAESWFGDGIPGAGQSTVEFSLTGTQPGSFFPVQLGSGASTILVTAADNATHTVTVDIPDEAHEVELSGMTLTLSVRGENVNVNNLGMSGDSFFTLPTLEVVEG